MNFESYSYIPIRTVPTTLALTVLGAPAPGSAAPSRSSPVNGMMSLTSLPSVAPRRSASEVPIAISGKVSAIS